MGSKRGARARRVVCSVHESSRLTLPVEITPNRGHAHFTTRWRRYRTYGSSGPHFALRGCTRAIWPERGGFHGHVSPSREEQSSRVQRGSFDRANAAGRESAVRIDGLGSSSPLPASDSHPGRVPVRLSTFFLRSRCPVVDAGLAWRARRAEVRQLHRSTIPQPVSAPSLALQRARLRDPRVSGRSVQRRRRIGFIGGSWLRAGSRGVVRRVFRGCC